MTVPQPSQGNLPLPSRSKSQWVKWMLGLGLMLVILGICSGGWALLLETGAYPSSHGFRVDGKAYRAYFAAQKIRPGTELVVETRASFVGPDWYMDIHLGNDFDPQDHVRHTTRGIPLVVEKYLDERRSLGPVITHDGRADKTTGYSLWYAHSR